MDIDIKNEMTARAVRDIAGLFGLETTEISEITITPDYVRVYTPTGDDKAYTYEWPDEQ